MIARVQQPRGVEIHEEQASSRGHQTGPSRFRRNSKAKPCVQPSSEGSCHPRATKGSPDSNKRNTTKSLTTFPVNVTRPRGKRKAAARPKSGDRFLLVSGSGNAATGRASLACTASHEAGQPSLRGEAAGQDPDSRQDRRTHGQQPRCHSCKGLAAPLRQILPEGRRWHQRQRVIGRVSSPQPGGASPRRKIRHQVGPAQGRPPKRPGHGREGNRASVAAPLHGPRRCAWRF